ncbi:MAG: MASE3 domain-containing protein [Methanobacteriota archaeon]
MARTNHVSMILIICIIVFLIGYALESIRVGSAQLRDYFQISTELLPLVLSFSIFVVTWFVFQRNKDTHSLFLGLTFFLIGLFDLYHILSYPFMPDFITPNSAQKSEIFWAQARIISAFLFLASVYVNDKTFPLLRNKPLLVASVSVGFLSFISLMSGTYQEYLPVLTVDGSPTREKMVLLIVTALMILYSSYKYTLKMGEKGNIIIICLIYGFVITAFSDFVYIFFDYPGSLLKASGYYFFYMGLFKKSVDMPYKTMLEEGEKRVFEAQERYRNLFDSANDAIIITDLESRVTSWNKSAERIFGWTEKEILGEKFLPLGLDSKLQSDNEQIIRNAISGGVVSGIETVLLRKDASSINVSMTVSPLRDEKQNVVGLSGIFRDITERKRAQEQIENSLKEKEVLLREIHHRVKNNMQIISSLLRLQAGYITEKKYKDMYMESQNRIVTMSLIHEKLCQSRDLTKIEVGGYIKELVNGLFISYDIDQGKITTKIDVENVSLGINSAIPCGLIINELISNSLKYAFPDGKSGEVRISLRSIGDGYFELIIADNGIGLPIDMDFKKTVSWGMRMVTILVENQLHGEILLNRDIGTQFHIKFKEVK